MKIVVDNKVVETKEIVSIKESGRRKHGFIIYLIDGSNIKIEQEEDYDMMPSRCGDINDRYRRLKDKVITEWNKDKTEITVLTL